MKKPFFSVIIPTLNEESYLPRLLTSLTKQKYKNFEVIIVDGKSTDHTKREAEKFLKLIPSLFFYIVAKKNVSYQRNFGATKARGEFLVFLDADTQIPQTFLTKIKKEINKGAVFLTTYLKPDSQIVYDKIIMQTANLITEIANLIGKPFVIGANTIVKKSIFKSLGGFDEEVKHAEDFIFALKAKKRRVPLTILDKPQLIFSLRRYRKEGRLKVLRKNAISAIHVLTKGPITRDIFSYPMGGGHYLKLKPTKKPLDKKTAHFLDNQFKKLIDKLFFEK